MKTFTTKTYRRQDRIYNVTVQCGGMVDAKSTTNGDLRFRVRDGATTCDVEYFGQTVLNVRQIGRLVDVLVWAQIRRKGVGESIRTVRVRFATSADARKACAVWSANCPMISASEHQAETRAFRYCIAR